MNREILRILSEGGLSVQEVSNTLEIGLEELGSRLILLESMGFVRKEVECKRSPSCVGCPVGDSCSEPSDRPLPAVYSITEKGKRTLERGKDCG